ncbi:MAG: glycosyltransferase [Deltaproteobacteria bacterium]|jgi:glycosyltransferase involved in cell wall biosynthesis/tetratricopeptide (TPR) repeat protein|nr:glycosyltransferase [Deltaproteobacteria bacterium]
MPSTEHPTSPAERPADLKEQSASPPLAGRPEPLTEGPEAPPPEGREAAPAERTPALRGRPAAQQDHPKVTALISTFNRPQYLEESIRSVVAQTMGDWELIVLNDGGQDVAHVVERFADPRIIYVPDDVNRGAAIRFNQGLSLARGDYVCYLGDDDVFYPNHFRVLSEALDANPEAGLAYSDLYASSSISDPATGQRFILDKQMLVSRDFNREFMFHFNHVLHVSLMHRREAALRVGGFDESVKVLIEWSLNRRLAFLYDFVHVEVPTGEYHMAVFKSDRISVRERRDQESYKHNLRRIRCNFPAEPWTKIQKVDLLYLVNRWGDRLNRHLKEIIDNFDHPMRIVLIGNGAGLTEREARASLKELAELKNISILRLPQRLDPVLAFRKAARKSDAKFVFLVTPALKAVEAPRRIFVGVDTLEASPDLNAIRWAVKGEEKEKSLFECLIYRDYFLFHTKPGKNHSVMVPAVTMAIPKGFRFDAMYSEFQKQMKEKDYDKAGQLLRLMLSESKGFPHIQYLIRDVEELAYATGEFAGLEEQIHGLLERGYLPDNYMRLCRLRHHQGRWNEAVEAGLKAIECLDLDYDGFDRGCFPLKINMEMAAFRLFMEMAESYLRLRRFGDAARHYHIASKLKADSYRPFLGFAKTYLEAGDTARAEEAMTRLPGNLGQKDPETHRILAVICRAHRNLPLAFECLRRAFECGPGDAENVEPFYYTGAGLGLWKEMLAPLQAFTELKPEHSGAWARLSSVYFNTGDEKGAFESAGKALDLDPRNPVARSILTRVKSGRYSQAAAQRAEAEAGLSLDTAGALEGILDSTAIVW